MFFLSRIFGFFSRDLGIDLGTANTLIYAKGEGIVLNEPSVIAVEKTTGQILAVGSAAKKMLGRTPGSIVAMRPLKDGVIADYKAAEAMIRYFITLVNQRRYLVRPRVVIGIPVGITEVEKKGIMEAAIEAGSREVYLIEEPMAAAIGVGLPVEEPNGSMIVDIGGGTTEVAVISLGGMVVSRSIRVAGDEIDETIKQYIRKAYNLAIGDRTAEEIKIKIGSAYKLDEEMEMEITGRDLTDGIPKKIRITSEEVREAIKDPVGQIVETVLATLEVTPPELAADIIENGIILTGGGSLLRGIDKLVSEKTGITVRVAERPLESVALGAGKVLEEVNLLKKVATAMEKGI